MNLRNRTSRSEAGFTLGEMMVTLGMSSVVGVCATYVFLNGTILAAKNTSENVAHDQNRIAVNRLVRDIHSAISTPQLGHIVAGKLSTHADAPSGSWTPYGTNVTFWADPGTGPAAGVSFKKMGNAFNANGGPFELKNDPGNKDLVMIKSGSAAPLEGMEIVFPYYTETVYDSALKRNLTRPMEGTIYRVTSNGANHYNVFIQGGLENRIKEKKGTHVVCYYMSRFAYVVENGNLNLYSTSMPPEGVTWPVTVARNIVATPDIANKTVVQVGSSAYSPATVSVARGESVQWTWTASGPSVTSKIPANVFNSGVRNTGATFLWTPTEAGTYTYTNSSNPAMTGTIVVTGGNWANAKPFSQLTTDYVTINLTTEDNRYSNRNMKAVNTLLAGSVPIRAKLSVTQ
jgi:plastocyanin